METLETKSAEQIFRDQLELGGTGTEIAHRMAEAAARIREEEDKTREEVAEVLTRTADDVKKSIGDTETDILPEGVAGEAYQGTASATVDLTKTLDSGGPSLIDAEWANDIRLHEERHEQQADAPNQTSVIKDGEEISWRDISEYDAIEAQKTPNRISHEYQQIHAKVEKLVGKKARDVALSGDMASLAA